MEKIGTMTSTESSEATTGELKFKSADIGSQTLTFGNFNSNLSLTVSVGKTYVTIKPDGEIVYGEGYTPDAAAKAFWDALGYERKQREPR